MQYLKIKLHFYLSLSRNTVANIYMNIYRERERQTDRLAGRSRERRKERERDNGDGWRERGKGFRTILTEKTVMT